ncbi:MAG: nucleotidyltransferase family protein [Clostridia bacterium]|nr:nucleotidyltransferase family protein [Clostridia bacterium]
MKCLILAAGYATRLYPLTENFPKPLLEVGGKSILDHLIEDIDRSGMIDEYIVISNGKFACHFEEWAHGKIRVVNDNTFTNETRLGAVRDIKFAIDSLGIDEELLVIAGDNLLDFSLCSFLDYYKEKKSSCVMRFYESDDQKLLKCGVLTVDQSDLVTDMTEKSPTPATHWVCPPFYIYTKEDARRIGEALEDGCGYDAPGSLVAWLCKKSDVYAMEMPGKRYDIGNLESYNRVKEEYKGIH